MASGGGERRLEVYLVRHGESEANRLGIMQGRRDYPLSELGRRQAQGLAAWLKAAPERGDPVPAAIVSSPLARAWQTAQILGDSLGLSDIGLDDDLVEIDLGPFSGLTHAQAREQYPKLWESYTRGVSLGEIRKDAESFDQVQARADRFLARLRATAKADCLIVVAHGGILVNIYKSLCGIAPKKRVIFVMPNGGVSRVRLQGDVVRFAYIAREVPEVAGAAAAAPAAFDGYPSGGPENSGK